MSGFQGEERGGSKTSLFYSVSRKVKQANKYGNNDKYFWGSREQRKKISGSREHELKTFLGTRVFINGEQGIKSKKIRDQGNMNPPGRGSLNKTLTILKHYSSPIRTHNQKITLVKIAQRANLNISGSGWQNKEIRALDWKFQQCIP